MLPCKKVSQVKHYYYHHAAAKKVVYVKLRRKGKYLAVIYNTISICLIVDDPKIYICRFESFQLKNFR